MFWIIGGEALVHSSRKISPDGVWGFLSGQLDHKVWEGVAFYDLIFPSFVFIVGVSLVFSLSRMVKESGKGAALRRIMVRSLILYVLGLLIYGGISKGWESVRWVGVLQRIAICYGITGVLFILLKARGLVVAFISLLVGYWVIMTFVPVRNINLEKKHLEELRKSTGPTDTMALFQATEERVSGRFEDGLNVAHHLDFQVLPGRKWDGAYDPEGLLSTLPAIATCIAGVLAGFLLRNEQKTPKQKVLILTAASIAALGLGFLWGLQFPVIKKIWTSSYVLVAGGWSCLFLAAFYLLVDVCGWRKWCVPFLWIGMNPIALYVIDHIVEFRNLADRFVGGPVRASVGTAADLLNSIVVMLMILALARLLYERKVFLKV